MKHFEELDYYPTPKGPAILRRRWVPAVERHITEILLGDEHLMSDLFIEGESELARRALALAPDRPLSVLVGGLGLGYTAPAAPTPPMTSYCWTSTIHPAGCWPRTMPPSMGKRAWRIWRWACDPTASSPCGQTTLPRRGS